MLDIIKGLDGEPDAPPADELSASALQDALRAHTAKSLVFSYEGRDVRPSYHVTEVKTGRFEALDCGAQYESWTETFIQLWDIEEETRGHMPVGKFLAIIDKVGDAIGFDPAAKLTFEVSDGVTPMQLYRASRVEAGDVIRVFLSARPSSCKPRDRWLAESTDTDPKPCCGPNTVTKASCCR